MQNWYPFWSDNEIICAWDISNLKFFKDNFNKIASNLHFQKINYCLLSQQWTLFLYAPGSKVVLLFAQFYLYPNFSRPHAVLGNNCFSKVDKVMVLWNEKATAML